MIKTDNYFTLFGVTKKDILKTINAALENGGEYADLFFEYTIDNDLTLTDSNVNAAGHHIDFGVGIRVVSGENTGYAYTEIITPQEMINAAKTASQIAQSGEKRTFNIKKEKIIKGNNFYPIEIQPQEYDIKKKIAALNNFDKQLRDGDDRIKSVVARISDSNTKILFYNSLGETFVDERPLISFIGNCVMESKKRRETGGASRSYRAGYEILTDELITEIANETLSKTSLLFEAKQPKGGEMPVVMGAGSSGILLHEAMGHAFEADFNRKKTSIFADKIGKRVCNENINIVDDGTVVNNRGSINYDDEGVPGQKTYMVTNGILTSYLHDRISAKYYGVAPTGNGRRESFRYAPIPRMRLTYMENVSAKESELISSIKKGIYVNNFSNGQVNIGAGDFTFYVKSGYLIENGKLTDPIKDINIIGNGPKALADIIAVADNNKIENATWTCGKGQYCPVSCGMPSVLIKKLTVGGRIK